MPKKQHAEFIQWMPYLLDALRDLGGGGLRSPNQVAWARQNLVAERFLTSPKRGIWMLTPLGQKTHLTYDQARRIFLKSVAIHAKRRAQAQSPPPDTPEHSDSSGGTTPGGYKEEMLSQLQAFTPAEFERFCADLLKHLGLERVEVTGGTGDKGIDGEGYLPIGPIVTTKIAFQCKRYSAAVSSQEVQSSQGAIGAAERR